MSALLAPFDSTVRPARAKHTFQITNGYRQGLRAFNDCRAVGSSGSPSEVLNAVIASMNRILIEDFTWFAVHAGVVQLGDHIVAFPARSGEGKTTLTAACLISGFSYLSDEALVLNDDGGVVSYPKPLALSPWTCEVLDLAERADGERLFTADEIGARVGTGGGPVTDIVLARYGASTYSMKEIPRSTGVAVLLEHSFNHYKDPARAFKLATSTAAGARVWKLEYDNPMRAAELLSAQLSG